jgi:hypothetical protein
MTTPTPPLPPKDGIDAADFDVAALLSGSPAGPSPASGAETSRRVKTQAPADASANAGVAQGSESAAGAGTRSRWWRIGYPASLVALTVLVPLLVWTGFQVILTSSDGELIRRVSDPSAAGYEAAVVKTPTALVVLVDPAGKLDSLALLALSSDGIGGVLSIPADTVVAGSDASSTLRTIFDSSGINALSQATGRILNLSFTDAEIVPSAQWATLVGPVAPVTVNNPDPVPDATGSVVFARGTLELAASQVWPYLSAKGRNESDLSRLVRQQAFWKGWLAEIGTGGGAGVVPISSESGLGRFVVALGAGRVTFQTLPVTTLPAGATGGVRYAPIPDAVADAVAAIVPFPEGAPGSRPRLRVLDGTGQLGDGVGAATVLAAAGGQIDVIGNARSFGAETTEFIYYEVASKDAALKMRDALGVGEIVESTQTNSATDLTVILGDDYLNMVGPSSAGTATSTTNGGQSG